MSPAPPSIRWRSDMLVTPASQRHLSQRIDALVQMLPGRYQPFFWGVTGDIGYDRNALESGILIVRSLDAVMRNGMHIVVEEGSPLQLPLSLDDGESAIVHLGLDEEIEISPHFVSCGPDAELVLGEDGVEIPLSKPRLVLAVSQQQRPADPGFSLCEVRRDGAACHLTDFLPPTLQVTSGSALGQRCAAMARMLRVETGNVTDRARSSAMVSALPALEATLHGRPHPFALYVELCRVAGAAAVLRDEAMPPAFPAYDHEAAHIGIGKVLRYLLRETGEMPSGFKEFAFERDGGSFRLRAAAGWTGAIARGAASDLVLAIEGGGSETQRWGENCVIATSSAVDRLLRRRLLGCARRRITPGGLPSGPHVSYFRITPDADAMKAGEDLLVIGNFGGSEPSALRLYVSAPLRERRNA